MFLLRSLQKNDPLAPPPPSAEPGSAPARGGGGGVRFGASLLFRAHLCTFCVGINVVALIIIGGQYFVSGYAFSDKSFFEKSIVASFKFELFKIQLNANDSV